MGGNCYGKALLDFDFECEDGESENDCELKYHENEEWFTAVLKDQDGNSCRVDGSAADFNDMIVARDRETMNRYYEIGYEARYETCTQLYKKRDLMLL